MKPFAITLGDPCGVGPEITLKALRCRPEYQSRCVLFGSLAVLEHYNDLMGSDFRFHKISSAADIAEDRINVVDPWGLTMAEITVGQVSASGGECAFRSVKAAIDWALAGEVTGVVTAPLNKEALHLAGHKYAGHTEIFAAFSHGDSYAMLLWSDQLKAIHATTHVSLRDAIGLVSKERVVQVVRLAHETLRKVGYPAPRIAVAGLNPHAGENGLFGDEEIREIIPAVEACRGEGIQVFGPVPPDTVFLKAVKGEYDIVVAMYHDQGHIPLKLLAFDSGVNITVGLDIVRTSVDHGTAFDIAGKLVAREDSILKAIELGDKL